MRVVIAPDAFKGTLTAPEASRAMAEGIARVFPSAELALVPMADGGEGTLEALLAAVAGERRQCQVQDVAGRPLCAEYAVLADGTAVIEAARVVGLTLSAVHDVPVLQRSSAGLGEMLRHVLDAGCRRLLIGLGGTATNDGGAGLLQALGVRLLDAGGTLLPPTPQGLLRLSAVDVSGLDPRLADCRIDLLSDVDNPLCGAHGATRVFGPQKGLDQRDLPRLDAALARYATLLAAAAGKALRAQPGAGAAGGLGFALQWLGARYRSGADTLLELVGFERLLHGADWVMTGEGRSDAQTLHGKAPCAVARRARQAGVPVALLSGQIDAQAQAALGVLFDALHAVARSPEEVSAALRHPGQQLADAAERVARNWVECRP
jgi:glycerate kinase